MRKCVFLDRDGNINIEKDYLYKVEDFEFEPGALEAIKIFKELGYLVVVVTNQSGVARGYYTEEDVQNLHSFLQKKSLEAGGGVDAFYYCPHHPEKGIGVYNKKCDCRKPGPGMFLEAKQDLDIDFNKSLVVGDKLSDVNAGENLGMRGILVRTGHGKKEEFKAGVTTEVYDSLYDFALKFQEEQSQSSR
ncbi:D-glycero-beta-D-manno-heptose 1,7-bisphosphate 7-phosphatase [uncultured Ilyobacter sp.]|uniref:D-glycero-beta-D-manno-heptose 1,7-bisphosphate 7-phosphatase n=1 Tax=uncultured Ilyobacter sp. TaxID=544433 RepID=UPI002AA6F0ED|nr:D-glycero-beta-D-manno-heptose 1,7-bisphosphate 7-phosphatase [uncultured Ilyobacter sp.]